MISLAPASGAREYNIQTEHTMVSGGICPTICAATRSVKGALFDQNHEPAIPLEVHRRGNTPQSRAISNRLRLLHYATHNDMINGSHSGSTVRACFDNHNPSNLLIELPIADFSLRCHSANEESPRASILM